MRTIKTIAAVAALAAALTGCDKDDAAGEPTTTAVAKAWDPCTALADDVIRRAGLDPATKEYGIGGVHAADWEMCGWHPVGYDADGATGYTISVMSSNGRTLDWVRNDNRNNKIVPISVGGRSALKYQFQTGEMAEKGCETAVVNKKGLIVFHLIGSLGGKLVEPPCSILSRVVAAIDPKLPK